jgi:hypothetical protein
MDKYEIDKEVEKFWEYVQYDERLQNVEFNSKQWYQEFEKWYDIKRRITIEEKAKILEFIEEDLEASKTKDTTNKYYTREDD